MRTARLSASCWCRVARLPEQFSFKNAKHTYGRTDDPTRDWLLKCIALGLAKQIGRGLYQKLVVAGRG